MDCCDVSTTTSQSAQAAQLPPRPSPPLSTTLSTNNDDKSAFIREHEESAKRALILKRKELKWRLMEASQMQNRAKLEEIRIETNYNKQKMIKIMALAEKLRAEYMKVAKAARIAETNYKNAEHQLLTHEKFVADEKMQLTKLAVDCRKIGTQLYGPTYKLAINSNGADEKRLAMKIGAAKLALKGRLNELEKKASINSPAKRVLNIEKAQAAQMNGSRKTNNNVPQTIATTNNSIAKGMDLEEGSPSPSLEVQSSPCDDDDQDESCVIHITDPAPPVNSPTTIDIDIDSRQNNNTLMQKLAPFLRYRNSVTQDFKKINSMQQRNISALLREAKKPLATSRLSPLYDLKDSLLGNLASYRLTSGFVRSNIPLTNLNYAHNICPNDFICLPDLAGTCTDKSCVYQHSSNYFMSNIDKLVDILSYNPSLVGFKQDSNLSREENDNKCRVRLKEYAAKLIAKNPDKSIETLAQNLVERVRGNRPDHELLAMTRVLQKISHPNMNVVSVTPAVVESNSSPEVVNL